MQQSYTLEELASLTGSELVGDKNFIISGVDELKTATRSDISFLANVKYKEEMRKTNAGAVCVAKDASLEEGKNYLISDHPSRTFQQLITLFTPDHSQTGFAGIHPTAVIHPTAKIGLNVHLGPFVVIDQDCIIGANSTISAHVTVCRGVEIGESCIIHPGVTIREGSILKNRVILQPGVVIGSCGYGYLTDEKGIHTKIKHYGIVILEDDVEIGSNTTIDRARLKQTIIRKGTKIDNLVMVAHNVSIGQHNLIVAQTGISGSSKTGNHVVLAGQVGVVGHIEIGDGVIVMARGAPSKSIYEKGVYGGAPAMPAKEYHKSEIHYRRLDEYAKRLQTLEEKIQLLENHNMSSC